MADDTDRDPISMIGTSSDAWFWLCTRGALVTVLGGAFAIANGEVVPAVWTGCFLWSYVLAWFAYMILFPARVRYVFTPEKIEAWRRDRLIASVDVAEIQDANPSWWEGGESGILPGLWPWPPRFGCRLTSGSEVTFPAVLYVETRGQNLIESIARVTGLTFVSSLSGQTIVP